MALTRKRPEDKTERWQPRRSVRVYFDDLDAILATIRKAMDDDKVLVDTGEFSGLIDGVSDLKETTSAPRIDQCNLISRHAGDDGEKMISVSLGPSTVVSVSPFDDFRLSGAKKQLEDILNKSQRRFGGYDFGPGWIAWVVVALVVFPVLSGLVQHSASKGLACFAGACLGALALVIMFCVLMKNDRPKATIILSYRQDAPTWWQQNHTAVLISLATNLVVGVTLFFIGKAVG
jgi:hypothetical protein